MTITKKFEIEEQKQSFPKKYMAGIIISIFVLTVVQIWANNTVVAYGEKFEELSSLKQTLNLENQVLENEIAQRTSITNLASKSAELGFSKAESIQYIR